MSRGSQSDPWAMFRRDTSHTGFIDVDHPTIKPDLVWKRKIANSIYSSPSIVDGNVFFLSLEESAAHIKSLRLATGDPNWQYAVTLLPPCHWYSVALSGGLAYVVDYGRVLALDARTGTLTKENRLNADWYATTSPTCSRGLVLLCSSLSSLHAFDAENLSEKWRFQTSTHQAIYSAPAVHRGMVYFATCGKEKGTLYCVGIDKGERSWAHEMQAPEVIRWSPTVYGGTVYTVAGYYGQTLHAVDAANGDVKWRARLMPNEYSGKVHLNLGASPGANNGKIFISSLDGTVHCLDAQDGHVLWLTRIESAIESSPVVTRRALYLGSDDGRLVALDVEDGKLLWTYAGEGAIVSSPAGVGQSIVFASCDGWMYCLSW